MKASILAKLDNLNERYQEVAALLSDAETIADQNKFRDLSKEYAELEPVVKAYLDYQDVINNLDEAKLLLKDSDPDMRAMAQEELADAESQIEPLELDLQKQLLPKDPNDHKNVFLKSVPVLVVTKPQFFQAIFFVCSVALLKVSAGKLKLSV